MARNIPQYLTYQYPDIKALLVEEEKFSREKLFRILKRRFTTLFVASNSVEGIKLYQQYKPDIIIVDITMDQMSQLEMVQRIREMNDKVQVILTTNHDDNDIFIHMIKGYSNHIILKPINLDYFFQAIQSSVNQIQLENEIKSKVAAIDYFPNSIDRVKFHEYLINEVKRTRQGTYPLSIIKMEIDFFQKIIDCFGKNAGEEVLTTISTIIQQRIREKDILGHGRTDEFFLLLPNTKADDAVDIAESLRFLIGTFDFKSIGKVTCSFGVTEYLNCKSKIELLNEAEIALHESKKNGRNRVTLFSKAH
ncbi:diguanylate cyclase [Neobacillus drentensis]|jgi:diguanylate cyclase (GGDEF)-like protein|uniref:diguanylate cyclase n=1 Tax=Neobacillus drentensis TaxID=220684 RepID=UPI002FFF3301